MIKVNYDTESTLVKGYYPDSIRYNSIPEPFIEIEDYAQILDKEMCVINDIYKEYVKPDDVIIEETKKTRISPRTSYLKQTDWYVAREADEPNTYPQEIKDKRILARSEINQIEACTTLEQVEVFDIEF